MTADILVINAGSSSVKFTVFGPGEPDPVPRVRGQVQGIGTPHPAARAADAAGAVTFDEAWAGGGGPADHAAALAFVVDRLTARAPGWAPTAVGHRVVHGGTRYAAPVHIDAAVRTYLDGLVPLAPLHQPGSLRGIDAAAAAFPGVPQVACFDTAFHAGRPFVGTAYALPREYLDRGVVRYGFHGLSYESIVRTLRREAPAVAGGRVVVAHLGNGASLAAVRAGRCVETTMGFTPTDGLPMGTRCGQLDPGAVLYLLEADGLTPAAARALLTTRSGLLGLSGGVGSDMRDLLASPDPRAAEAVDYFVYRVTYFVGALAACLGGLDAVVFTAGIGEHATPVRERVCRNLAWTGLELDAAANAAGARRITAAGSRVAAFVLPTDEDRMIAAHVVDLLGGPRAQG